MKLMPGPENRELAIGYGHVKDADKLYAISNVNENDIDFSRYSDIYQIIEERFSSSVQVRSGGEIVIRNSPTMSGSNAALLIVDGRQVDEFDFGIHKYCRYCKYQCIKRCIGLCIWIKRGKRGCYC